MKSENFCYWLHGFFELLEAGTKDTDKLCLTSAQTEMIKNHLKSVFETKIMTVDWTPKCGTDGKIDLGDIGSAKIC